MHALKKNILLHLQTLAISNNYPIFMVNIIFNCLIIFPFHFILCMRFSRSLTKFAHFFPHISR